MALTERPSFLGDPKIRINLNSKGGLEQILEKLECQKREQELPDDFQEIEQAAGFALSDDYKRFLRKYGECRAAQHEQSLVLWPFEEILPTYRDYEIFENLENLLGIGSNAGSEMMGLRSDGRCVLMQFIGLDQPIEIGTSFTDMLERLEAGRSWFE